METQIDADELYVLVSFMVHYALVLAMFVVNFFADAEPQSTEGALKPDVSLLFFVCFGAVSGLTNRNVCTSDQNPSPEEGASFPSRMVYQWFDRMAWRGFKAPLEMKDLWDLNLSDQSKQVVPDFNRQWTKSLEKRPAMSVCPHSFFFFVWFLAIVRCEHRSRRLVFIIHRAALPHERIEG